MQHGSMNILRKVHSPSNPCNATILSEDGEIQDNTSDSVPVPTPDFPFTEFPSTEVVIQSQIDSSSISDTLHPRENTNSSSKAIRDTDSPLKTVQNRASYEELRETDVSAVSVKHTQSTRDPTTISVLSGKSKQNIKPTSISQVLVSETVPSRRVQLSREAKKTRFQDNPVSSTVPVPPRRQPRHDTSTRNRRNFRLDVCDPDLLLPLKQTRVIETDRHLDLREPQLSSSDSHPASLQPVSETTTSESSVSLPSSPSGSSCTTSTSTGGTDNSSSETSSESSSQPSSNASSPETTTSASSS